MLRITLIIFTTLLLILSSCGKNDTLPGEMQQMTAQETDELKERAMQLFGVLPDAMPGSENDTPERIALGKKLFFETALSENGTQSCNTCHDITGGKAGVDNFHLSPGALPGTIGTRNSNTVLNSGFQFVQFWDGRSPDLQDQAKGPILNPIEMGIPEESIAVKNIYAIEEYHPMFDAAFPNDVSKINYDNIAEAIAAFERTLISKSRFDDWLAGNPAALKNNEKHGLNKFIETGCTICHSGPLLGGNIYHKSGLIHPYENQKDLGRFEVTGLESDKYMFKVPMMRNVALTEPYFHDGGVPTLKQAVKKMAYMNLGKEISDEDRDLIIAFLKSLTDSELEKGNKNAFIN